MISSCSKFLCINFPFAEFCNCIFRLICNAAALLFHLNNVSWTSLCSSIGNSVRFPISGVCKHAFKGWGKLVEIRFLWFLFAFAFRLPFRNQGLMTRRRIKFLEGAVCLHLLGWRRRGNGVVFPFSSSGFCFSFLIFSLGGLFFFVLFDNPSFILLFNFGFLTS